MRKRGDESQLDLNLPDGVKAEIKREKSGRVVPFVDAATLEVRRNAVRRATASGIFSLPPSLRQR